MTCMRRAGFVIATGLLAGCGGGGGGGTSDVINLLPVDDDVKSIIEVVVGDDTVNPKTAYTRSSDFASHWGHAYSGVEDAYKKGITGAGRHCRGGRRWH